MREQTPSPHGTIHPVSLTTGTSSTILATSSSSWPPRAPDAFSYGPQVIQILPNAGTPSGGDTIQIYGYGFGSDPTKLTAKIAGATATVQQIQNVADVGPSLGLDSTYPFPLECITLQTPTGASGKADIAITSPAGSVTALKAFQYLQGENFYVKPSFDKFVIYDQPRQWLYLSDIDHIDVFNLAGTFFGNVIEPPGGPPPSGQIRGLALTPDGTQLIAADFGAQNIYLQDPTPVPERASLSVASPATQTLAPPVWPPPAHKMSSWV